jgi:flagellar basal body-associated protein FliL
MNDQPPRRSRFNRTQIFLIVMVAVALTLAAMTIASSLMAWQERDAAAEASEAEGQPES